MKIQTTLTVEGGKRLIAHAIVSMPQVKRALAEGRILLKGGTTVSAVSELLCGQPLRICGRMDVGGTGSAKNKTAGSHSILLEKGCPRGIDDDFEEAAETMQPGDICITGANLIDKDGRAAIMAGSPLGGAPLRVMSCLSVEGVRTIIAAGFEKYAPCSMDEALLAASRKGVGLAMGMASGLVPIDGLVINEARALLLLGAKEVHIIGRGGINGGEGGTTFSVEVPDCDAEAFFAMVRGCCAEGVEKGPSGEAGSLPSCLFSHCGPTGAGHRACCYRTERNSLENGEA